MTRLTAQERAALAMSETDLQRGVEDALTRFGWRWHHETDSRRSRAGFPDIAAVHPRHRVVLFSELKDRRRRVEPEQAGWLTDVAAVHAAPAPVVWACLWRPEHYDRGLAWLARPDGTPPGEWEAP